jgi:hypothetical protein
MENRTVLKTNGKTVYFVLRIKSVPSSDEKTQQRAKWRVLRKGEETLDCTVEAQSQTVRSIEGFYNRQRRHSAISCQSPENYERFFFKMAA